MNFEKMVNRVRQYTRDTTGSIFKEADINSFLNEAIDRIRSIPELKGLKQLNGKTEVPTLLPSEYRYLIPIYASARCFEQDERHYQAVQKMNEFESKLEELRSAIESGDIVIVDSNGLPVTSNSENDSDYVIDVYYKGHSDSDYFD